MASTRRKSAAIALAIVGVAGLSLASAATLSLSTSSVQAGSTTFVACQDAAISVAYTTAWDSAAAAYRTTGVTVSGIASGCNSKSILVTLTGAAGASLHEFSGATGTAGLVTLSTPTAAVDPVSILGVAAVISG